MFSTLVCCAFMPLAALKSALIICHSPLVVPMPLYLGYLFDGLFAHVVGKRDRLLHHFELPGKPDNPDCSVRCADVGRLDFSLINFRARCLYWILTGGIREIVRAVLGKARRILQVGDVDVPERAAVLRDFALARYCQRLRGIGVKWLAALLQQRVTFARDQGATGGEAEVSVARIKRS